MKTKLFTLFFALMASINLWAIGRNDGSTMTNAIDFDWINGVQQSSGTKWYHLDLAPLYDSTDTLRFHITNLSNTESVDVSCRIMIMGETDSFEQTLAPHSTYDTWEIFYEPLVRSHQIELYFVVSSSGTVNLFWQRLSKSGDSCEEAKRGGFQEAGTKWHILESPDMEEREYIDSLVIHFENTDANYNYNDISNTISVSFKTDCNSPEFYSQTFTIEPYDENTIAFSAVMLASLGWPDLVFTCTSSTSCRIIYGYHGDFPHEPSGEWCGDALNLAWEPVEQQANMDLWYLFNTHDGTFNPIIPDTCDLRIKISNISDENANVFADVYVECSEPALKAESYILQPFASDSFDIDRDMLERFGWPPMIYNVTSDQNISIQAELIPDAGRDFVQDTIVAYVCEGDEYIDTIGGGWNFKIISPVEHSMTWIDTFPFRNGLQMMDSIITFYIHPLIMPEPLSAEEMRGIGAAPLLVQGMQLYVDESNAALTEYYRNLGNSVDTITHIDTAYWAKPVYKANGDLDSKKEAPLDLSKYYSKNEYMDTLLLVVKGEECEVTQRIEYIFPIEGIHYSSIADLYNMAQDSTFTLGAFDVVYVPDFQNGSNMYIKDETGSMVIYKVGYGLQAGDHVEAGLQGKISIYNGIFEIIPISQKSDLTITAGEAPAPMEATEVPSLTNVSQFVVYKNVSFATDTAFVEGRRHAVKGTWNGQQVIFYNQYYIGATLSASKTYNITAVNAIYVTNPEAYPLAVEEVTTETSDTCVIASGTCGENLTWTLSCDGVLTISGTGEMEGYSYSNHAPWYDNRSSINSVVITEGVTSIGDYAFHSYYGLTSVTFSNSVTTIGNYAFYKCSGLTSLRIGEHVTSFDYRSTFDGCNSLTYISVDASNPNYCSVDGVLFNKDATIIVQYPKGKQGAYTIPNSVTSVGRYAFRSCNGLTSITIPNSVTNIGYEAFSYCRNLISIEIPNSVTSIGSYAFDGCSNLTSITIPNSVKNIGSWAFMECSSITSVSIPSSVTTIGQCAFGDCSSLTSIEVATDNPNYCSVDGVLFNKEKNTIIQFPAGKEDQSYSIPTTVKTIYDRAFVGCSNLIDIMIPTSVTKIGQCVFGSCAFTSIIIPNSVTNIGMSAFWNCSNLSSITCEASTPPVCDLNAFDHVNKSIPVYVPIGSGDTYASADGWKDFTNILAILDIPDTPGPCLIASGTCGENLTWELSCDSVLTISGTGAMVDNPSWSPYVSLIKAVIMPEGLTIIGRNAFAECVNLESAQIPESVTAIGPAAFYNCSALTSINMPDSVRMLGHKAFVGCESLTEPVYNAHIFGFMPRNYCGAYSIPEGIVSVAAYAFCGIASATCSGLTEITIPSSVKRLGVEAFGLLFLRKITCLAVTPPTCDSTTFEWYLEETGITVKVDRSIPVYVPAESVDAYKTADVWKEFFNILPIGGTIEPQDSIYDVVYLDQAGLQLDYEPVTLHLPEAPQIEGFTFLKWQVVAGDLEQGIYIQAVYTANEPTNAPEVYTNPANKAQKLIRNGKVYILTDDKVYSISGQKVK